jgi:hypothetical protein
MSFYLYRIFQGEETLYIGKGSGYRLSHQKRRFRADGEIIVDGIESETDAYRQERALIALHKPPLNKHVGGNGGWSGVSRNWAEAPNGLTPEGLAGAAPIVARLINIWRKDQSLNGILSILGAYIKVHGEDVFTEAVVPHLRRLIRNDLALESKP